MVDSLGATVTGANSCENRSEPLREPENLGTP